MGRRHGRTGRCGLCGATMLWARSTNGRAVPIHPTPEPAGTILLSERGTLIIAAWINSEELLYDARGAGFPLYRRHRDVCTGGKSRTPD